MTLRNQSDIPLINVFLGKLWIVRMVIIKPEWVSRDKRGKKQLGRFSRER